MWNVYSGVSKLKEHLKKLMEKHFVKHSISSCCAPVSLVKNNYGTMRLCVDYQVEQGYC